MLPKFLRDKTKQEIGREGENNTAKRLTRQLASGALWFSKADLQNEDYLVEVKTTEKTQYILKAKTLEKILSEANVEGKQALFVVNFGKVSLTGQVTKN